jgi:hypothetical protein
LAAKNWLFHHNTPSHISFFTRKFFAKNNMTVVLSYPTHLTFLFPRLKTKPNGRHFDSTEMIDGDSHVVMNTLTELDFQDVFLKWQKGWGR